MDYDFVQDYPGQPSRPKKSRKFRGPKSKAAKILVNLLVTAILGFLYFYLPCLPSTCMTATFMSLLDFSALSTSSPH